MFWTIIIVLVLFVILLLLVKLFTVPKAPCVLFVSGEVKGGKTLLQIYMSIRKFKKVHFIWVLKCKLCKLFDKPFPEEPVYCSNIPVAGVPYVPLTREILRREVRLPYKSVTFVSESHLVIDSMTVRNPVLNEEATLFYKLYGHATRGGFCFVESQSLADNHYSLKRSISRYYQIFNNVKIKPFFALLKVHELAYSEDNSTVNINSMDYDDKSMWVIVPWSTVKKYDCYTYSTFTDDKEVVKDTLYIPIGKKYRAQLKTKNDIVSFRKFHSLEVKK